MRRVGRAVVAAALASLAPVGLWGCAPAAEVEQPPNVVLLVLDTVRMDHLSCYGYGLPTTPGLDAFAAGADRYTEFRATAPWTLPSHASMFTGQFPFQHGAQSRLDPRTDPPTIHDALPLALEHTTLAEVLSDEGYATGGFVANGAYLGRRYQLDQGFDVYVERTKGVPAKGPSMNAKALTWLESVERGRPYFLFVNYIDAHRPYNIDPLPPERAAQLPAPDPEHPVKLLDELCFAVLEQDEPPDPALIERVITQYDTALANLDLAVEALLAELEARGLLENTLIVITSDHGEFFGEHDVVEHSKDVYEEGLRIPMLVKRPGQTTGRVIDDLGSLADLPCIVLDAFPAGAAKRLGASFPCGGDSTLAELRYTRRKDLGKPYGKRFLRERTVLYSSGHKLIASTDGKHELYDLAADPQEQNNLFREDDPLSQTLLTSAVRMRTEGERPTGQSRPPEQSADELEMLKQLGYVDDDDEE